MANACAMQQVLFVGCNRQPSYVTSCSPLLSDHDLNQGEVLIKIVCAAICPDDLEKLGNKQLGQELPSGLGHEGVGEIVVTKRSSSDDEEDAPLAPGDRIVFCSPLCSSHETPDHQVFQNLPSSGDGVKKYHFGGTFSTHCILKRDAHVFKLPDRIPSTLGAIANCPLATMTSVLTSTLCCQQMEIQKHSLKVAIVQGTTIQGLFSCAFLRENGFDLVIFVEKNHSKWKLIKAFGGTPTSSISRDSQISSSSLQSNRVAIVIDTDHCRHFCASALDLLSPGGVYILAGTTQCDLMQVPTQLIITKNLTVTGAHNYSAVHLKAAVDFLSRTIDRYPYEALVTSPFPFSSFNDAIGCAAGEQLRRVIIQATNG